MQKLSYTCSASVYRQTILRTMMMTKINDDDDDDDNLDDDFYFMHSPVF